MAKDTDNQKSLSLLLEFIYKNTSLWAETLEKYNDYFENKSSLLLYECIYFYMFILKRVAHNKLELKKAQKLHDSIRSTIIIGIVNFVYPDEDVEVKNKARLDFFSRMELAEIEYQKHSKSKDIPEDESTPVIIQFRQRIEKALKSKNRLTARGIAYLSANLYEDFLDNKLIPLEKLVLDAGKLI